MYELLSLNGLFTLFVVFLLGVDESHNALLQFGFFHSLGILGHGKCVDHVLNVAAEESLQVVGSVAYAVVGDAALWEVVGAYLCTAVAGGDEGLAAVGNVIYILLMPVSYTHLTLPTTALV